MFLIIGLFVYIIDFDIGLFIRISINNIIKYCNGKMICSFFSLILEIVRLFYYFTKWALVIRFLVFIIFLRLKNFVNIIFIEVNFLSIDWII